MTPSNVARVLCVAAAVITAAGSASSSSQNSQEPSMMPQYGQPQGEGPPPPQQMEPGRSLGLWRSTFGAVKIEADNAKGGIQSGALQGVWVYQRQGQEVIGYFSGTLRGNVLDFRWQEPGQAGGPPLNGEGWLQFDASGRQYRGRWWSDRKDRVGAWNGWRQGGNEGGDSYGQPQPGPNSGQPGPYSGQPGPNSGQPDAYGGQSYGGSYSRQPPPQPQPQPQPQPRYY
jgi:hypothetical protein